MGTILPYIGALDALPHGWFLCDGNNGTPDLRDHFLEGSTFPGTFIKPGLPNIVGGYDIVKGGERLVYQYGAFKKSFSSGKDNSGHIDGFYSAQQRIVFDASTYSPIYSDTCTTVQPATYTVYFIIRLK